MDTDKLLQISSYPIFIHNTDNIRKICKICENLYEMDITLLDKRLDVFD
jgi:hypothetical protein